MGRLRDATPAQRASPDERKWQVSTDTRPEVTPGPRTWAELVDDLPSGTLTIDVEIDPYGYDRCRYCGRDKASA